MEKTKAFVIINEQHKLFPEQEEILQKRYDEIEFVKVPASGWTLEEMRQIAEDLHNKIPFDYGYGNAIVFASPIPYLLRELAQRAVGCDYDIGVIVFYDVLVFHNDKREKKELPDGRIIQTVAATGWRLV